MEQVTQLKVDDQARAEWQMRVDLAAAFRLAAAFNWHEAVANHFSLAVSPDGRKFLMNPRWRHFSRIRASDLLLLDAEDESTMDRPDAPDPSAWCIHGRIHRALPQARCILHLHSPYATAIATLADPEIKPIDQNTARFYNRVAYDMNYGGIADSTAEGDRLVPVEGFGQPESRGEVDAHLPLGAGVIVGLELRHLLHGGSVLPFPERPEL
jgi:ribulose-5-phosphate 4-epimerase/fuculose-1-phosphate aldolase